VAHKVSNLQEKYMENVYMAFTFGVLESALDDNLF
jgi:hypothetical protein